MTKKAFPEQLPCLCSLLWKTGEYMKRRYVITVAAASAFWLFLSLVPTVILFTSLLPYTAVAPETVREALSCYAPEAFQTFLDSVVDDVYTFRSSLLPVSLLTALWSSALGFSAIIRGLEDIYDRPRRTGFLRRRLKGVLYTLSLLLAILLAIMFMGFGRLAQRFLESRLPGTHGFFLFLPRLRFGVVQCVLVLLFSLIYRFGAGIKLRYRSQLPGAVFAALGWTLFSAGFSIFVSRSGSGGLYGSLATVALVMVWMYWCMLILLGGGCLNRVLERSRTE